MIVNLLLLSVISVLLVTLLSALEAERADAEAKADAANEVWGAA